MRNRFAEALYEEALRDDRIAIVVSDISPAGSMGKFRTEFPDRFVNVGVAEQSMIGICAGMALRGLKPVAYTIATFSIYRPFEMVRDDLCYHDLPVTVVGIGGGITYSTLGGTHHAQEDIAVMTAIPNMTVLAPSDPDETAAVTQYCMRESKHPVYLRIGKAGEPNLSKYAEPFQFGKVRMMQKDGNDICILSYGTILKMGFEVAEGLRAKGRKVSIVGVPTVKPLDRAGIAAIVDSYKEVVVIEEHAPTGGLSHQVKEIAYDRHSNSRVKTFTLKDEFIHLYGTHDELMKAHGLNTHLILSALEQKHD